LVDDTPVQVDLNEDESAENKAKRKLILK